MNRSCQRNQAVALLFSLAILSTLWLLPGLPPETAAAAGKQTADDRIAEAMSVIASGNEPMRGITLLREVLAENPENRKALMALGYYSIQSGQYGKAMERFAEVVRIYPQDTEAWYFLGEAQAMGGETGSALASFRTFVGISKDRQAIGRAQTRIKELEQTLMN